MTKTYQILNRTEKAAALLELDELSASIGSKYFDYFRAGAGELVELHKPSMIKVLWYDDEQPDPANGPGGLLGCFLRRNMNESPLTTLYRWREAREQLETRGCCAGCWAPVPRLEQWREGGPWRLEFYRTDYDGAPYDWRDLEPWEVSALLELADRYTAALEKKLRRYFERHQDQVYTSGYWANA